MPLAALLLLAAAQPPEPPRTVNGEIIGKAEDYMIVGPGRVCLGSTIVDLEAGETAWLDYLGIHWRGIRVSGAKGSFQVKMGGAWAEPRGESRFYEDWQGRTIYRGRRDGRPRYLIYGSLDPSEKEWPLVWVEGDALGRSRDGSILNRITISRGEPSGCRRQFDPEWDVAPGDGG